MAVVKTPVKGFTGTVVGVDFKNGEGETDNPAALAYFERQGYEVGEGTPPLPAGKPSKSWSKKNIAAFLTANGIEASESETQEELLAKVPTPPAE